MDTTGKTVLSKNAMKENSRIPFDKTELTAILKFGAAELFSEKNNEHQDLDVDIDDILNRAETRECDNVGTANDLLSSFKYANFVIDEERDLASLSQIDELHSTIDGLDLSQQAKTMNITNDCDKGWNEIIPIEEIERYKECNKTHDDSELAPRPRVLA